MKSVRPRLRRFLRNEPKTQKMRKYHCITISPRGSITQSMMSVTDIFQLSTRIQARDVISLSLQETASRYEQDADEATNGQYVFIPRPPPAILPRGETIVFALGHLKAIIELDKVHIFDAHIPAVRTSAGLIAYEIYKDHHEERSSAPFELVALESAIKAFCERYARRVYLYHAAVEHVLGSSKSNGLEIQLHQMVPLKDSLSQFQLNTTEVLRMFLDLANNEQDMLDLLITERSNLGEKRMDPKKHEGVELLLENYHRQLLLIQQQTEALLRKVQSSQDFTSIHLDLYRNRLIALDVYLSVGAVALGMSTAIAGFFGMNVLNPLEGSDTSTYFLAISAASISLSVAVLLYCKRFMYGLSKQDELIETRRNVLQFIMENMGSIEHTLYFTARENKALTREEFRKVLRDSMLKPVTKDEVEFIFNVFRPKAYFGESAESGNWVGKVCSSDRNTI